MASREQFSSRSGFIMAAAGSAIGLGNIWGFPTQTANNGGAAFVMVYLVLAFLLAYPALMAELIIGRHARANMVTSLRSISTGPLSRLLGTGIGFYGVMTASLILSFYAIVSGWIIGHFGDALLTTLGMPDAGHTLSDDSNFNSNFLGLIVFMCLTMSIIASGVTDGIEKWSSRLMPMLLLLLTLLIGYVLTQDGASDGLQAYLIPDFSDINPDLVVSAMGQAFFSMSLGVGAMLVYGSYLSDQESLPKIGATVTLVDAGIAILAGLLIIPAIYVAAHNGQLEIIDGQVQGGPGLIFGVLPALFSSMGAIGSVVALVFFALLTIAALTSSISMLEVPVSLATEETPASRKTATLIIGTLITAFATVILLNMGTLFDFIINLTTVYSQPLLGVALCIFVGWVWHRNDLLTSMQAGSDGIENTLFWTIWPLYVQYLCPALILLAFYQSLQ